MSQAISLKTHYLLRDSQPQEIQWAAYDSYVIAPRDDCLFFVLDLESVPNSARIPYVRQQVNKRSPWASASYYLTTGADGTAAVWMWDDSAAQTALAKLPPDVRTARIFPESALLSMAKEGAVIRRCARGYDFQLWQGGALIESRWQLTLEDDSEIALFQRVSGQGVAIDYAAADPDWQPRPWTEAPFSWRRWIEDEIAVMTAVASAAVFLLCLEMGMAIAYGLRTQFAGDNVLALQEALGERLQYRLEAERLRTVNQEWAGLRPAYTHLEVVAEFTRLMEGQQYDLVEWEYQRGGLQVTLSKSDLDTKEVVTRLESGDLFAGARIEPGLRPNEYDISINIAGVL